MLMCINIKNHLNVGNKIFIDAKSGVIAPNYRLSHDGNCSNFA